MLTEGCDDCPCLVPNHYTDTHCAEILDDSCVGVYLKPRIWGRNPVSVCPSFLICSLVVPSVTVFLSFSLSFLFFIFMELFSSFSSCFYLYFPFPTIRSTAFFLICFFSFLSPFLSCPGSLSLLGLVVICWLLLLWFCWERNEKKKKNRENNRLPSATFRSPAFVISKDFFFWALSPTLELQISSPFVFFFFVFQTSSLVCQRRPCSFGSTRALLFFFFFFLN